MLKLLGFSAIFLAIFGCEEGFDLKKRVLPIIISQNISVASAPENTEVTVTLDFESNHSSESCSISNLQNLTVTTACSCSAGVCTVGVTGDYNFDGVASFDYVVSSSKTQSNTSTVELTVVDLGEPPTANALLPTSFDEDTESIVTLSYTDPGGNLAVSCELMNLVNISETTDCSCAAGTCTVGVTGDQHYNGSASFDYTVRTILTSNQATATLTIDPVDDVITSYGMKGLVIAKNTSKSFELSYYDETDATGCTITYAHKLSVASSCACTDGICSATFNPSANYIGDAYFNFTLTDGTTSTSEARANVTVIETTGTSQLIASPSVFDFGVGLDGYSKTESFTLYNSGPSSYSSVSVTETISDEMKVIDTNCSGLLASYEGCYVTIEYSPTGTGSDSETLSVSYSGGTKSVSVTAKAAGFSSLGTTSLYIVKDSSDTNYASVIDYGNVYGNGTIYQQTVYIKNTGSYVARLDDFPTVSTYVDGLTISPAYGTMTYAGGSFPGTGGDCNLTDYIAPGDNCSIVVELTFTSSGDSTGEEAEFSVQFDYWHNGVIGNTTRSVRNYIYDNPVVITNIDFGDVDLDLESTTTSVLEVENLGVVDALNLNASVITLTEFDYVGGSYPGTGGDCSTSLAAGSTCSLALSFTPSSIGRYETSYDLNYELSSVPTVTSSLFVGDAVDSTSGSNTAFYPVVSTSDTGSSVLEYGNVFGSGTSYTQTFYLKNEGASYGMIYDFPTYSQYTNGLYILPSEGSIAFTGGAFPGTGGTCDTTTLMAPGESCSIVIDVTFDGAGSSFGTETDYTFRFEYWANGEVYSSTRTVRNKVFDNPVVPDVSDLGGVDLDFVASTTAIIRIDNLGSTDATSVSFDASGFDVNFDYTGAAFPGTGGTCSTIITQNSFCTIEIEFTPLSIGPYSASLNINFNIGATPYTTTIPLSGDAIDSTTAGTTYLSIVENTSDTDASANLKLSNLYGSGTAYTQTVYLKNVGSYSTLLSAFPTEIPYTNGLYINPTYGSIDYTGSLFPGTGGTCDLITFLTPGDSCSIQVDVTYSMTGSSDGTEGAYTLYFEYWDNGAIFTTTRNVLNTIFDSQLIGNNNEFENVNLDSDSSTSQLVEITNSNSAQSADNLTFGSLGGGYGFTGGSFPGTSGDCSTTLASDTSCTLDITFTPTSGVGFYEKDLTIDFDYGGSAESVTIKLSGSAISGS